jgi:25S rRNA (adenine2142-N1)-methyltransferase
MTRKRKTKLPVTHSSPGPESKSAKPKSTRTLIRRFHVLLKRRAVLEKSLGTGPSTARDELKAIEAEMNSMGGLEVYQQMSAIGQGKDRGGGSETVLIQWMKELGMEKR